MIHEYLFSELRIVLKFKTSRTFVSLQTNHLKIYENLQNMRQKVKSFENIKIALSDTI